MDPVNVLLLLLALRPCILSRLESFVKDHIDTVQVIMLRHQYQAVIAKEIG